MSGADRERSDLSHVGPAGDVRMVDVGGKPPLRRRAVARATVRMGEGTAERLRTPMFAAAMEALEHGKDFVGVFGVKANAVVLDSEFDHLGTSVPATIGS